MDHAAPEIGVRGQELFPDPNQIVFILIRDRHARAHACMDEQIITLAMRDLERVEEMLVRLRDAIREPGGRVG